MRASRFFPGDKPLVSLVLFLLTLGSTFSTFFIVFAGGFPDGTLREQVWGSACFATCLLAILGAHEMGHYLWARRHGVATTLPFFIPLPLVGVGTLGAIIRIKGRIPHRNALLDIGASGPLAGFLLAVPLLILGLFLSKVGPAPEVSNQFPGPQSLWVLFEQAWAQLQARLTEGATPPAPEGRWALLFGDNLLMKALVRIIFGPLPEGHDVHVHPLVIAAWFGLLVTMLNLLPVGQLDGGHVAFAVLGKPARWLGQLSAGGVLFLSLYFSAGWLVWWVVTTFFIGFRHPPVEDDTPPLSRGRRWVAFSCLLVLVLCLMPIPLSQVPVP